MTAALRHRWGTLSLTVTLGMSGCTEPAREGSPAASASAAAPAVWLEVKEANGFLALFPTAPKKEVGEAASDARPSTDYIAWDGPNMYSLHHTVDARYAGLEQDALRTIVLAAVSGKVGQYETGESGKVLSEKEVPVAGGFGKEVAVQVERPLKGINHFRILLAAGHYYDLMVFVADGDKNGDQKRFFDSFKMLPK